LAGQLGFGEHFNVAFFPMDITAISLNFRHAVSIELERSPHTVGAGAGAATRNWFKII